MLSRSALRTASRLSLRRTLHSQARPATPSTFYAAIATVAFVSPKYLLWTLQYLISILQLAGTGCMFAWPLQLDADPGNKTKDSGNARAKTQTPRGDKQISYGEVQKHNTRESCWVVIRGQVSFFFQKPVMSQLIYVCYQGL
jgi:hypothetical protein